MYIDFFIFQTFFLRRAPKSFNVETKFPFLFFSFIVLYPPRYLPLIIYHNLRLSAQSLFQYIYSNWHIYNETDSSRKFIMVNRVKKHAQSNFNPIGHVYCSKNIFMYLFCILLIHFCTLVWLFDFSLYVKQRNTYAKILINHLNEKVKYNYIEFIVFLIFICSCGV